MNNPGYLKADPKEEVAAELREVFMRGQKTYDPKQAHAALQTFAARWGDTYDHIHKLTTRQDLHYYFTYLDFDWHVQSMLYRTNWVERLNKSFRRSTKIRNALPSPDAALLLLPGSPSIKKTASLDIPFIILNLITTYFHKKSPEQRLGNLPSDTLFWTVQFG